MMVSASLSFHPFVFALSFESFLAMWYAQHLTTDDFHRRPCPRDADFNKAGFLTKNLTIGARSLHKIIAVHIKLCKPLTEKTHLPRAGLLDAETFGG